jgi:hypothetical protein
MEMHQTLEIEQMYFSVATQIHMYFDVVRMSSPFNLVLLSVDLQLLPVSSVCDMHLMLYR